MESYKKEQTNKKRELEAKRWQTVSKTITKRDWCARATRNHAHENFPMSHVRSDASRLKTTNHAGTVRNSRTWDWVCTTANGLRSTLHLPTLRGVHIGLGCAPANNSELQRGSMATLFVTAGLLISFKYANTFSNDGKYFSLYAPI